MISLRTSLITRPLVRALSSDLQVRPENEVARTRRSNVPINPKRFETQLQRLRRIQREMVDKDWAGLLPPHMTDDNFRIEGDRVYRVDPFKRNPPPQYTTDFLAKLHKRYDFSWEVRAHQKCTELVLI